MLEYSVGHQALEPARAEIHRQCELLRRQIVCRQSRAWLAPSICRVQLKVSVSQCGAHLVNPVEPGLTRALSSANARTACEMSPLKRQELNPRCSTKFEPRQLKRVSQFPRVLWFTENSTATETRKRTIEATMASIQLFE